MGMRSRTASTGAQVSQRERAQRIGQPSGRRRTRTPRKLPRNGAATIMAQAGGPMPVKKSSRGVSNMGSRSGRQSVMLARRRSLGPGAGEDEALRHDLRAASCATAEDAVEALSKLGPALLDSGAIDQRTLERARRVAAETGGRLDRVLTQLGLISERGLAEALAPLLGAPLAPPRTIPTSPVRRSLAGPIPAPGARAADRRERRARGAGDGRSARRLYPQRGGRRDRPAGRGRGRGADRTRSGARPALFRARRRRGAANAAFDEVSPTPSRPKRMPSG